MKNGYILGPFFVRVAARWCVSGGGKEREGRREAGVSLKVVVVAFRGFLVVVGGSLSTCK